jgi:hypothetical protein
MRLDCPQDTAVMTARTASVPPAVIWSRVRRRRGDAASAPASASVVSISTSESMAARMR